MSELLQDLAPAVEFGWPGRIFAFVLLVGVPSLAALRPGDGEYDLPARLPLYASAVLGVWALAGLTALVLAVEGVAFSLVGFQLSSLRAFIGWTAAASAVTLIASYGVTRVAGRLGIRESRLTYHLMPRSGTERAFFMVVSASAGLCEEFVYHGFLLAGLAAWLGNGWVAALVANLAFGVLHGYQGQAGMLRAGLMGYALCIPVIVGAGLWPAIAAHFLVNALLGLGLWKWMVPPLEPVSQSG